MAVTLGTGLAALMIYASPLTPYVLVGILSRENTLKSVQDWLLDVINLGSIELLELLERTSL